MCYGMPAGVVRVKGVLAFDEDRLTRSGSRCLPCLAMLVPSPLTCFLVGFSLPTK